MEFKEANGTLLKDGDYILSTGDGLAAFTMKRWTVGVFRQRGEDGFCVEPLVPPADGSYMVHLPCWNTPPTRSTEPRLGPSRTRRKKPAASTV